VAATAAHGAIEVNRHQRKFHATGGALPADLAKLNKYGKQTISIAVDRFDAKRTSFASDEKPYETGHFRDA
jgi:hypothetical protein